MSSHEDLQQPDWTDPDESLPRVSSYEARRAAQGIDAQRADEITRALEEAARGAAREISALDPSVLAVELCGSYAEGTWQAGSAARLAVIFEDPPPDRAEGSRRLDRITVGRATLAGVRAQWLWAEGSHHFLWDVDPDSAPRGILYDDQCNVLLYLRPAPAGMQP